MNITQGNEFALDVVGGKILSGKRRVQACQRFLDELEMQKSPDYPWMFNTELARRVPNFIEKFIVPSKGAYNKTDVLPWESFVIENTFGWVSKKTGLRRFNESLCIVGQGNGKSTIVSGVAIEMLTKDGEKGAEVYTLANSKDQAKIVFGSCLNAIDSSPLLRKHIHATKTDISYGTGFIKALSSEVKNLDGLNVHLGIFDEIHEYRDYKLINVIKGKTVKRKQPLIFYITTLGSVIDGPLMDLYVLGGKVLDRDEAIDQRAADRMFVYIDEIDEDDDPDDWTKWGKANPSLGTLLDIETLKDKWARVKSIPEEKSNFINKQLNVFTKVDELSFLDPKVILRNNKTYDLPDGSVCYGGFDLSNSEDFTAAVLEFPLPDNQFFVITHTWVPKKKMDADNEKLDWQSMIDNGWLTVCPGEYVDYTYILNWFLEMREKYRIESIGYDPAKAYDLVRNLQEKGFVMNVVRQGEITLTAPLDNLKERFIDGNIIHNNNKLFNWYLGNVKLTKRSANSTYLPTKQNRYRKIDAFAALLDAHCEYMRANPLKIPEDKKLTTVLNLRGL